MLPMLLPLLFALAQPARKPAVFPASVDLVHVSVSVTTKNGEPIHDLEMTDFILSEDGKKRPIETFLRTADVDDSEKAPVDLILLLDTSSSMDKDLRRARDVMADFVKSLPSPRGRGIVAFGEDVQLWPFDADNIERVLDDILVKRSPRGTLFFDGVAEGLRRVSVAPGRKAMVAFTDGEDYGSAKTENDVKRWLVEAEVTFYAISYARRLDENAPQRTLAIDAPPPTSPGSTWAPDMTGPYLGERRGERAKNVLGQLASATGGVVLDGVAGDLATRLTTIRNDIATQYVLGFTAPASRKTVYRKLKVEVKRKDVKVRHREGYEAKPQ